MACFLDELLKCQPTISGESPFAPFSPFAPRGQRPSGAPGVLWSGVATSKGWQRPDLDSERIEPFVDISGFFTAKCHQEAPIGRVEN